MYLTKINQNGQISIPAKIRKKLNLKSGDHLRVEEDASGKIWVIPVSLEAKLLDAKNELNSLEKRGVDLSLIRENLKRSPTERLAWHNQMAAFVNEIKKKRVKNV